MDAKEVHEIKDLLSELMVGSSSGSDRTAFSSSQSTSAGAAKGLNKLHSKFTKEIELCGKFKKPMVEEEKVCWTRVKGSVWRCREERELCSHERLGRSQCVISH